MFSRFVFIAWRREQNNIEILAPTCKTCVKESRGMRVQSRSRVHAKKAGWKMDMDEEADSKKIRIKTRKICKNQLRDLEKFTYKQAQRSRAAGAPQDIEQKRNDLLLEHQNCRRGLKSYRACKTKRNNSKRMLVNVIEKWSGVQTRLQNETFSSKTWNESFKGCAREKRSWIKKSVGQWLQPKRVLL